MANAKELDQDFEVSLVENYARAFGIDPDVVMDSKEFNNIVVFTEKWNREARYQERYREAEKLLNDRK